jgi:FAD/FMN-containing dehydrogenase/Fe-S oxidoreductase
MNSSTNQHSDNLSFKEDLLNRILYSTDASAYREMPDCVVSPKSKDDIIRIIKYSESNSIPIIPRAGGTSLAGQVVGKGIIVDITTNFNKILEININENWVRVEPGIVLDELNIALKPFNLMFGPETSTANRCSIGGMIGNNSCGSHSLIYGSTRDHLLEVELLLSDGTSARFSKISLEELKNRQIGENLENNIYKYFCKLIEDDNVRNSISDSFPDPKLKRRNTGYAVDVLLGIGQEKDYFNLCELIAGSEGTLGIITEAKLNLVPLPPTEKVLVCAHCNTIEDAFDANLVALKHRPMAVEMMDSNIINLSKSNISQNKNRFFIHGEPAAILIIELASESYDELSNKIAAIDKDLNESGLVYHSSFVFGKDISKVWELRKAGLGLLSSLSGDAKPVSVIEDTAVTPERLPDYMADFSEMLKNYNLSCVYHAHIGTGELHLRPLLNLKTSNDIELFKKVAYETACLVKKHKGSLSGEHGDGRLRGEFIPLMYGEKIFKIFKEIKALFDPNSIFNPGKITDTPSMSDYLRYIPDYSFPEFNTYFDYSTEGGWLRAIEQCNGSGDCRKSNLFGGTMCPSFRATGEERDVTRGRANVLRELLTYPRTIKIFDQKEILESLDLCISCKACKSECPSNVDMAKYKAEFLQHYYDVNHVPIRSLAVSHMSDIQKYCSYISPIYNKVASNKITSRFIKYIINFHQNREIPKLNKFKVQKQTANITFKYKVHLFLDEFTRYNDKEVIESFVFLLNKLGYEVLFPKHIESGRASLSKGLLKRARRIAIKNVNLLKNVICNEIPLVGIEPSAILSFRDEYPNLVGKDLKKEAENLAQNCLLYDEFIMQEFEKGHITANQFTDKYNYIKLHGHCHQKSLASVEPSAKMLSIPLNYKVDILPTGCCGMAGSFGYEREHYDISMKIGEQSLFPLVREAYANRIISAPGVSCRQQILDGTGVKALHPISILKNALLIY